MEESLILAEIMDEIMKQLGVKWYCITKISNGKYDELHV